MKILITAGGTSEKIDQVRSITNHSTGRLGKTIAETFVHSSSARIDYVTTSNAVKPETHEKIKLHLIESTLELFTVLKELLKNNTYDAIIHSMAVSDFTPAFSLSEEQLATSITTEPLSPDTLPEWFMTQENVPQQDEKISSNTEHLVIVLKKTPKIISYLREWQPTAKIIGFKLLVDVSKEQLLAVAQESILKNRIDYILANDLTEITEQSHHGYLLSANGEVKEAQTKQEIAELIVQTISQTNISDGSS